MPLGAGRIPAQCLHVAEHLCASARSRRAPTVCSRSSLHRGEGPVPALRRLVSMGRGPFGYSDISDYGREVVVVFERERGLWAARVSQSDGR